MQVNAKSVYNCSCIADYCIYGRCRLTRDFGESKPSAKCKCDSGYTGRTCKYPTYYLIGVGTVFLSVILTLMAAFIYRFRRQNAIRKSKLKQLQKTFAIPENELVLLERIDLDCRESYSKVYKATYRRMAFVAIKALLMDLAEIDNAVLLEFIREIEIMSLLSHKNIVKCFGAGRFNGTNPFLVLEYVEKGSLRNILYPSPICVTSKRKYQFALDAANGMEYLHGQKPPRIHRDLKTANLLVDDNWTVKVADFGCSKVLKEEGRAMQPKKGKRNPIESEKNSLLAEDRVTVWHIGTLYWSAPEVLLRRAYGTPADVYSYGIALWEIMTRMPPYEEYADLAQCTREETKQVIAVEKRRPTIPDFMPTEITQLIQICWSNEQKERPRFSAVVERLRDYMKTLKDDCDE